MVQACVKMNPFPILTLVISILLAFSLDEPSLFHAITTIPLADHTLLIGCFTLF